MRALERPELEAQLVEYLKAQQDRVDAGADVESTWKTQRRSASMKRIVEELRRMTVQRAARAFLGTHGSAEAEAELRESVTDNDGYGLTIWFFLREGREESPFSDLRRRHPGVWERMRLHVADHRRDRPVRDRG